MDVNLTHVANVTLTQPVGNHSDLSTALIAFAGGALVAIIAGLVSYYTNKKTIDASLTSTRETNEATNQNTIRTINASLQSTRETIEQEKSKMLEEELQEKRNKRHEAYSLLLGRKYTMLQFHASYYSIFIKSLSSLYHGRLLAFNNIDLESDELRRVIEHRRTGSLTQEELNKATQYIQGKFDLEIDKSPDVKESLRTKQRSEELQLELAKSIERFFEIVGRIEILFPSQEEVRDLIEQIEKSLEDLGKFENEINQKYKTFDKELRDAMGSTTSIEADSINSNKKRYEWVARKDSELSDRVTAVVKEVKKGIEDDLDPKIEKLLKHLEVEIKKEENKVRS